MPSRGPMSHTFITDIDEIAQNLIGAFELTFEEHEQNLCDPLIRWLDYRLRYIDPSPRKIVKSIDFDARVPREALPALEAFITLVESGADLNHFQTKSIKRNDTSGTKRQLRTDGLWADWRIHHAHLTEVPLAAGAEFSERSEWLLFFLVFPGQIALIDVRSHNEPGIFQSIDLVEKLIRSWPDIAQQFKLNGVMGLMRPPSTDGQSVKDLRRAGVTQMLEVDGAVYMPPGFGVTSAATSTQVSLKRDRIKRLASDIDKFFSRPENPLMQIAQQKRVENPSFAFGILPTGHLSVFFPEALVKIPFPSPQVQGDARSELEQILLPPWAGRKLVTYLAAKQAAANTSPS